MADTIWVPAYIRRKPAKPEAYRTTHRELLEAYVTDSCVKEVEKYLADLKLEQAERERVNG